MNRRKNIMLIVAHDLGQHIGPYGVQTVQTPNLDRMARQGVLFQNNFCVSPGCSPSRATIMTGRYPHSNGVMGLTHDDFLWRLNKDENHLAHVLAANGYNTCLLGNWHENNRIDNVGYTTTVVRNNEGLALSSDVTENVTHPNALDLADRADFYLKQTKGEANPFFLYVGIFEPHRPFNFKDCEPDTERGVWIPPYIPQETEEQRVAAEEEFGAMQGCIKRMDVAIGQLMESLERNGLKDDTLVLFTSDHGVAMPRAKCSLYDPGVETPLMFWGGGIPENKRHATLISNVDYFPTLLEWCGIPIAGKVQGRSFLPLLKNEVYEPNECIFSEKNYHRDYDPIRSIRTDRHKLIINFEFNVAYDAPSDIQQGAIYRTSVEKYMGLRPRVEFYDLDTDPWEQNNLKNHPMLSVLKRKLLEWMKETGDPLLDGPIQSIYNREIMEEFCND